MVPQARVGALFTFALRAISENPTTCALRLELALCPSTL